MNKTKEYEIEDRTLTVPMETFVKWIGAGRATAEKIAIQAEAKVYIGKRVLININKVRKYLDEISE